jgi:2'-5' RNA ligase
MRLFVGSFVPDFQKEKIFSEASVLKDCLGVRLVEKENYHFTLKFLGEVQKEKISAIKDALSEIDFKPFSVRCDMKGAFPSIKFPRAIWIGGKSQEAESLASKIEEALSFLKLKKEKFFLHITVARSKGAADIENFLSSKPNIEFEVSEFSLIKSNLLPFGASYESLYTFKSKE